MLNVETFRALCQLVVEEQDESKLELLQKLIKLLLADRDRTKERSPET